MIETEAHRRPRARADAGGGDSPRRRSRLLQRRQAARRPAGGNHRRQSETGRRAQARSVFSRAALRQADPRRRWKRLRTSICAASTRSSGDRNAARTNDELACTRRKNLSALDGLPFKRDVGEGQAQIGGGTLPRSAIESVTLDLIHRAITPQEFAARLRDHARAGDRLCRHAAR